MNQSTRLINDIPFVPVQSSRNGFLLVRFSSMEALSVSPRIQKIQCDNSYILLLPCVPYDESSNEHVMGRHQRHLE